MSVRCGRCSRNHPTAADARVCAGVPAKTAKKKPKSSASRVPGSKKRKKPTRRTVPAPKDKRGKRWDGESYRDPPDNVETHKKIGPTQNYEDDT